MFAPRLVIIFIMPLSEEDKSGYKLSLLLIVIFLGLSFIIPRPMPEPVDARNTELGNTEFRITNIPSGELTFYSQNADTECKQVDPDDYDPVFGDCIGGVPFYESVTYKGKKYYPIASINDHEDDLADWDYIISCSPSGEILFTRQGDISNSTVVLLRVFAALLAITLIVTFIKRKLTRKN